MSGSQSSVKTPTVQSYGQADYRQLFLNLLPRGRIWRRDPSSISYGVADALAPTYVRSDAAAAALIADVFPATTVDYISEWESTLGLPDPCQGEAPTTAGRVAQIVARFVGRGGQSVAFFEAFAAILGFQIQIQEFTPFRVGDVVGLPLYDESWASAWSLAPAYQPIVTGPLTVVYGGLTVVAPTIPTSALSPSQVLVCEFDRLKPAHSTFLEAFFSLAPSLPNVFVLDASSLDGFDWMA